MHARSMVQVLLASAIGAALAAAGSYQGEQVGGLRLFALLIGFAFLFNWLVYVPSFIAQTEHYFDLTGAVTYVTVAAVALALTEARDARTVALGLAVMVWALRLGTFLFRRVKRTGKDGRFDKLKTSWSRFFMVWTTQAVWITFTAGAALAAMTATEKSPLGVIGVVGLVVWAIGFGIEVVADNQKSRFRSVEKNKDRFISTGLWAWSRHPNYVGEILLWTGIAIAAFPALSGWQYITLISPVLVYMLLTKASGIPMLEARADKKWGGQADYESYKAATPVLFPKPPS